MSQYFSLHNPDSCWLITLVEATKARQHFLKTNVKYSTHVSLGKEREGPKGPTLCILYLKLQLALYNRCIHGLTWLFQLSCWKTGGHQSLCDCQWTQGNPWKPQVWVWYNRDIVHSEISKEISDCSIWMSEPPKTR